MHPGVEDGDGAAGNLLGWLLLRAKSVQHVVLILDFENVKICLKVLGDEVDSVACNFLLLVVTPLGLLGEVVAEDPQTRVAEDRTEVGSQGTHEVFVVESHHLRDKVLGEDTAHPDLLVGD